LLGINAGEFEAENRERVADPISVAFDCRIYGRRLALVSADDSKRPDQKALQGLRCYGGDAPCESQKSAREDHAPLVPARREV